MKAVIPCARKKESLFPFTESRPTGLLPVMGVPIVKHLIRDLQSIGVDDIFLVTNYKEDMYEEEFEEYTNVNIVHQEETSGTADALKHCDFIEEDFFVVNGDVLVSGHDLETLKDMYSDHSSKLAMLATEEEKPEKFGVLSITNSKVTALEEKPETAENPLINTGIYVFDPEIFDLIDETGTSDLTEAVEELIDNREARFELVDDYWIDIDSTKKLWKADRVKRDYEITETDLDDSVEVDENVSIDGEVVVEQGAELKPGAVLEGKVYIGKNSTIGPNTIVRDSTVAKGSIIESATIDSSFLFERNIVDSSVSLKNTVIGEEADIKPGTVITESFIGPRSFIEMNNSIRGVKFVPDARTDLSEISK